MTPNTKATLFVLAVWATLGVVLALTAWFGPVVIAIFIGLVISVMIWTEVRDDG